MGGRPSPEMFAALLGGAGGIMVGVVFYDLLPSAYYLGNFFPTVGGMVVGLVFFHILDTLLVWLIPTESGGRPFLKMGYLIALGIALHDLPEGFAIAAGYAAPGTLGVALVIAIGLHNIPEGMAIAVPLHMAGLKGFQIVALTLLVSLFTPLGTQIGILLINISQAFVSVLLAMAGGAMLYLVVDELLPEASKQSLPFTVFGFGIGILVLLLVQRWFG